MCLKLNLKFVPFFSFFLILLNCSFSFNFTFFPFCRGATLLWEPEILFANSFLYVIYLFTTSQQHNYGGIRCSDFKVLFSLHSHIAGTSRQPYYFLRRIFGLCCSFSTRFPGHKNLYFFTGFSSCIFFFFTHVSTKEIHDEWALDINSIQVTSSKRRFACFQTNL